ncbi:putative glyoxal oxidase precursor [Amylocarpus encephaloides]|uniref:Glyoxal oxidase n=1 Tax=Amylocarpus encephaloides TaxID=45428 RepID=A0A9P7YTF0_9HELO|nr:putative glyoxal oxidase precursor [Amylocarpus encephaloides]
MGPSFIQAAVLLMSVSPVRSKFNLDFSSILHKRAPPVVPEPLPGTWQYQGCYTENGPRTLSGPGTASGTLMTDEYCIAYCDQQGYIYAGTEYSSECFCGNAIGATGAVAPSTDCNMGCSGNSTEVCGGGGRLTLFWNGQDPPPGPSTNPGTSGYGFFGCYTEGNGGRALSTGVTVPGGAGKTTVALCIATCQTAGFTLAGVEYGSECYCDNTIKNTAAIAPGGISDCNVLCAGNTTEYCGAGNRLDIYKQGYTGSQSTVSSVVISSTSSSSSTNPPSSSSTQVSTTSSSTSSSTGSSTSSSTGSSTSSTSSSSSTGISSSSTGTTTSSSATASPTLGIKPTVGTYSFLGCYNEAVGKRALAGAVFYDYALMTLELCASNCAAFKYFGVEYGGECFCGNTIDPSVGRSTNQADCSFTCPGNEFEYCGAGNRLEMYGPIGGTSSSSSTASSSTGTGTSSSGTGTSSTGSSTTSSPTSTTSSLPPGWKYDGCYTEGTTGRALTAYQGGGATNTVESCINTCIGLGYTVAGMEYSEQCFCDKFLYNGAALTDESQCQMNCAGNGQDKCGGPDRLSLYHTGNLTTYAAPGSQTTGLPGSWVYQGCYNDNVGGERALFWQSILRDNNTATNCLSLCSKYGYMAAGMQYGQECFCGDNDKLIASGSTKQPETDCQVPCSGDQNYYCGGGSRTSYYRWIGNDIYTWNKPTGNAAGEYRFLIGGVVVPLITTAGINKKVVFMEKAGTGAPNTTGTYELDLAFINDFSQAWRPLHVKSDIFCSAGITLPDKAGRQLNIGGWSGPSTYGVRLYTPDGSPGVAGNNDWQENVADLTLLEGRWYPSALVMTNGSVFVIGGEVGSNAAPTPTCEILPKPPGGYAKYLDWLYRTDPDNLYPFLWVLPSGGIFIVYYNEARILDEKTFDTIKTLPNLPGSVNNFLSGRTYPLEGTGVMLPMYAPFTAPVTVLVCGGSANGAAYAVDNCVSIQPEAANPTWVIERMPSQRVLSCIVALPDGTYLILNGAQEGVAGFGLATDPNYNAVLYDPSKPVNQRMSIMANTIVARLYHSEAILLPDGRVMVSGSNPEDAVHPEEYRVEVFLPPYALSTAGKPSYTITTANKDWAYDSTAQITATIPSGNLGAVKISMMAAVSSTHGNSMGQRTLFLSVSCAGSATAATCTINTPPTPHVAPPGWYMIFVLDGGIPGEAEWVRVGGSIADAAGIGSWPAGSASFTPPGLGAVGS